MTRRFRVWTVSAFTRRLFVTIAGTLAVVAPVYAHHSFAANYFEDQRITVRGPVVEFQFKNPHAWVRVVTTDEQGAMVEYSGEWAAGSRLQSQGILRDTLKVGDYVVMTGAPARAADQHRLHLRSIERPADGWKWGGRRGVRRDGRLR